MGQERFADVVERFANGYADLTTGASPEVVKQWQEELERGFKRMTNLAEMVQHPVEPRTGQTPREEIAERIGPVLANPPATGLLVFDVQSGSQSATAGLAIGDILTHYDGEPLETTFQLTQLARKAAREKHRKIPVLARRGSKDIDAEFDPAPLGVHLVGVKNGDGRTLWRPDTSYEPDLSGLQARLGAAPSWQILKNGDKTEIRGFGSFRLRARRMKEGRNPKTGATVAVPAKKVPFFKAGKELKELLNQS